jgi:hypothetical protein
MNGTMNGTMTIDDEDDGDVYAQLMWIIFMSLVLLCGCCIGCYVCYRENQNTKRWSEWVKAKKMGVPTVIV